MFESSSGNSVTLQDPVKKEKSKQERKKGGMGVELSVKALASTLNIGREIKEGRKKERKKCEGGGEGKEGRKEGERNGKERREVKRQKVCTAL